jgi:hypothetical protein
MKAYVTVCAYLDRDLLNVHLTKGISNRSWREKRKNIDCPINTTRMTYASEKNKRQRISTLCLHFRTRIFNPKGMHPVVLAYIHLFYIPSKENPVGSVLTTSV